MPAHAASKFKRQRSKGQFYLIMDDYNFFKFDLVKRGGGLGGLAREVHKGLGLEKMEAVPGGIQTPELLPPVKRGMERQSIGKHPCGIVPVIFVLFARIAEKNGKL
jgi:hypothetical protein